MDIQVSLCLASMVTAISYILFNTEALAEYGKLFKLNRILKLEEYFCFKLSANSSVNYFDFLKSRNNNFIWVKPCIFIILLNLITPYYQIICSIITNNIITGR